MVRINNSYFQVKDNSLDHKAKEYMMLLDRDYSAITSNYKGNTQQILKEDTKKCCDKSDEIFNCKREVRCDGLDSCHS
ncbi:hypothetical protein GCM10020331_080110 [Ectobacillus funiculus]